MGGVIPKPCLDCGDVTTNGNRCVQCQQKWEQKRNSDPKRIQGYGNAGYRNTPVTSICYLCLKPGADTRDHIFPLAKQMELWGEIREHRVRSAHRECNSRRGAIFDL